MVAISRARLSHTWDGINFFRGSGGPFFIKGNPSCGNGRDCPVTVLGMSRDTGRFRTFPLRPLAVAISRAAGVERDLKRLNFLHGDSDGFR